MDYMDCVCTTATKQLILKTQIYTIKNSAKWSSVELNIFNFITQN